MNGGSGKLSPSLLNKRANGGSHWILILSSFVFLLVLGISIGLFYRIQNDVKVEFERDFNNSRKSMESQIEYELNSVNRLLAYTKGVFVASDLVTLDEFKTFVTNLNPTDRYKSLEDMYFVQNVRSDQSASFEKEMNTYYPGYKYSKLFGVKDSLIVKYDAGLLGQNSIVGEDVVVGLIDKSVFDRAKISGDPIMSPAFESVNNPDKHVFAVVMPVYRKNSAVSTETERVSNIYGYVVAVFQKDLFFNDLVSRVIANSLDIEIFDGDTTDVSGLFYDSNPDRVDITEKSNRTINFTNKYYGFGHIWTIYYSASLDNYIAANGKVLPYLVLIFGGVLAISLGALIYEVGSSRSRIVRQAEFMVGDLRDFKLAVENASSHIIITDKDGRIVFANKAASDITGFTKQEMIGQNPRLWGGIMPKDFYINMWQVIKNERKTFRGVVNNKRKNGEEYTAQVMISPIVDDSNELIGFVGMEDDITTKIRAERALIDSEARFKALIENSSDAIALIAKDGMVSFVSTSAKKIIGYSPEEVVGTSFLSLVDTSDQEKIKSLFEDLTKTSGKSVDFSFRVKTKSGEWRWIDGVATNAFGVPNIDGIIVNYRDSTEKKMALESLALESKRLSEEKSKDEAILNSIGDGVVVMNQNGLIVLANPESAKLLGFSVDEMVGKSYTQLWQVKDGLGNIVIERPIKKVLSSGITFSSGEFFYTRKDGSDMPVYTTIAPLIEEGKVVGAIDVFRDISKEKAIDIAKSEFVSLASHQLRTPLSAVNWYAEMLLSGDLGAIDPAQKKYLEEIYGANRRMVELVNALLNVSRIDLGTFAVEPEDIIIEKIAEEVVKELRPQIVFKKLEFSESYDPNIPTIKADPKLTKIVIQNLLANAVKYTPETGKIGISLKMVKAGESVDSRSIVRDSILLSVSDNGYGIPENQKDKIFSKLFRADNVKSKDPEGTGLGLYVAKSVVDSVGGEIWFKSIENEGTTFYVTLPVSGMAKKEGTKQLSYGSLGRVFA